MATILVVDDEMGIRELLSEILSDEGHVVEAAENAQEAREFRLRQAPDLVLLDIWMPDTDGVTLLKEWAAQGQLTMPVIMMSGHATIDTAVEATKIGALNFLEKPIALQKLLKAVEQGLARGNAAAVPGGVAAKPALPVSASSVASAAALPILSSDGVGGGTLVAQTASISFDIPLRDARDAFERAYFEYHLARENGSMTRVAEKTGLERTHLYRKLKQLGVDLGKNKGE
ncbi:MULTISPECIES: response regulator transcription factor EsaR [unclassified Paraburkholderia]|uniref:response regulator transcription factor EsaR n=1 Tax=unclassified Paraburkholderia TaxID=2615204 RepID=UPI001618F2B4|nr:MULTISPECIES: response regulator transcription factor EsaR [unclassified Paraburkholderia]MBB5408963.1 DNA-binding NtrC family response regulator [Paraburkholderia sp. HC6.4b]MBB5450691.1 DNA-binding NtrC family response regulator [Paraburkholderia sp. Kb1A]MBB5500215.1 DNA-binding NtrC family response regulator [Paraburkholderia sp. MM5384-R2]MBC8723204.1 response regulator [Paraburkholderia sp. 31.1]